MKDLNKLLSIDESEALADMLRHEGWKALIKLIDGLVEEQEYSVIKLSSEEGADKLLHAKLKSEGARKLRVDIEKIKAKFKDV